MKSELEEPLAAFAGGMKERRKIVQTGIEKLLKVKTQQTLAVNKEERKNKMKLEKTQIQLSSTSNEYETAVKALEETTGRWNREWKAACDVRLSLEVCEVEKDIMSFIKDCGTGQEIPDPPKFINFARGDINDAASEISEEDNYSVAQFQRTTNPAFRTSSPQPSTREPIQETLQDAGHDDRDLVDPVIRPQSSSMNRKPAPGSPSKPPLAKSAIQAQQVPQVDGVDFPEVPHNEYPMDGMTQFCRIGPPSDRSSAASPVRPNSRDAGSDYSNPTSYTSQEPSEGPPSPTKSEYGDYNDGAQKKKSGFFQNRSPFRRKSTTEKGRPHSQSIPTPVSSQQSWAPNARQSATSSPERRVRHYGNGRDEQGTQQASASPEPIDPRANFQLNVGSNVFDVASPDRQSPTKRTNVIPEELDPIAQALAELKGVTKQASTRQSADRYHGLATPAPGSSGSAGSNRLPALADRTVEAAQRGTPPPSYDQPPVSRLGAPQPAFTSRQMQQTTQRYLDQNKNMFNSPSRPAQQAASGQQSRPDTRGSGGGSRATSPVPFRSASPRPGMNGAQRQDPPRAVSPSPMMGGDGQSRSQSTSPSKPRGAGYGAQEPMRRAASPQPQFHRPQYAEPQSDRGERGMQLASPNAYNNAQQQARGRPMIGAPSQRPMSYEAGPQDRTRSRSIGGNGAQFSQDGRPILHFCKSLLSHIGPRLIFPARAMYMYQAAIPEELSFAKGDTLAVLRLQDDGWWEAEVVGKRGRPGLVPSNYLAACRQVRDFRKLTECQERRRFSSRRGRGLAQLHAMQAFAGPLCSDWHDRRRLAPRYAAYIVSFPRDPRRDCSRVIVRKDSNLRRNHRSVRLVVMPLPFGFGIGDFIAAGQLAWTLYLACDKSPSNDFKALAVSCRDVYITLRRLESFVEENQHTIKEKDVNDLAQLCKDCRETLTELDEMLKKYQSLVSTRRAVWDRIKFGQEDLHGIRERLTLQLSALSNFMSGKQMDVLSHIQRRLEEIAGAIARGDKAPSLISDDAVADGDVWADLRQELLADHAISPEDIEQNREQIRAAVLGLMADLDVNPGTIMPHDSASIAGAHHPHITDLPLTRDLTDGEDLSARFPALHDSDSIEDEAFSSDRPDTSHVKTYKLSDTPEVVWESHDANSGWLAL
ncbi:hypothetical protein MRB53_041206 [Persea americana]|nr:hypothetical protein MRB53_041206 [Persea americana]